MGLELDRNRFLWDFFYSCLPSNPAALLMRSRVKAEERDSDLKYPQVSDLQLPVVLRLV